MKNKINVFAGAALLALALVTNAIAIPITGSIAFNGAPNLDSTALGTATGITSYDAARVAVGQQFGTYASVADLTPVVFSPFIFSPATQSVTPLWSFQSLGNTYSFSTTSMTSMYNSTLNIWNFGGKGVLSATGFDNTVGDWFFSVGQSGQSLSFSSGAAAANSVPDSGMTVVLLGLGVGLMGFARRSRRVAA